MRWLETFYSGNGRGNIHETEVPKTVLNRFEPVRPLFRALKCVCQIELDLDNNSAGYHSYSQNTN